MSEILIIKSTVGSFEQYYNQQMRLRGADILDATSFYPATGRVGECLFYLKLLFNTSLRKKIRCYKKIVVFERADLIPILLTFKRKEAKIVLWIWNTYSQKHPFYRKYQIVSHLCTVYTMDSDFARGLNINSLCQFHFPDIFKERYDSEPTKNPRAYFIGRDKGRSSQLSVLSRELQSYGVICDFQILRDETSPATFDSTLIFEIQQLEDYPEVLRTVESSDIVVDLCKEGQTALTVRVLEACIFGKKLITNNIAVKDELLYNSQNIFILGYDELEMLPAFVYSPGVAVSREILDSYSYEAWIQGLFI